MPDVNLIKLVRKNLLVMLRASVGTPMFRHIYVRRKADGQQLDTMVGGELSCAFYASSILAAFGLIDHAHSTVTTTLARMQRAGWVAIDAPRPGVVIWGAFEGHEHIGFMLDNNEYISHSLTRRTPQLHGQKLPDGRQPIACYWHPALDQD